MNDRPHTVIGVLPPIPQYPNENDVYMPTTACPFRSNPRNIANRKRRLMSRVRPAEAGARRSNFAASDVAAVAQHMKQDYPASIRTALGFGAQPPRTLRDDLTRQARPMLLVLLGAAAFVLLIACANVANLMLARMARREQELVIRTAVGAGSGRLLRQLLTESLILALAGRRRRIVFAAGSRHAAGRFASQFTPRAREIAIDGWVLGFRDPLRHAITTLVFGSMAALYARGNVAAGLKEGGRADRRAQPEPGCAASSIAAQVAFSFVLLIGAGLMVRSFMQLQRVDTGIRGRSASLPSASI